MVSRAVHHPALCRAHTRDCRVLRALINRFELHANQTKSLISPNIAGEAFQRRADEPPDRLIPKKHEAEHLRGRLYIGDAGDSRGFRATGRSEQAQISADKVPKQQLQAFE